MAFDKDGKTVLPANIYYDRKKEIYYADKVYKGERIYFAGKTKAEAEKRLRKRLYEIDMHISPQKKSNVTVEELFELYVGEYHPELKPTTVQQYRFLYDYYLKDFIGKVKLKNLLPYHIQKVYNHLVEKKMKQGTVNNVRKMLRTLLNEAVRRGMLSADDNPYPKVKAPSNLPVKQQRSFTEEQRDQFLQYAGKSLYANLYKLLLYTGMRVGDDDDKIRLNQRKPSKYKGLSRFGPEKNLQRINKFMKERPTFYKKLIQMKENFRFYLRCFYCITKVVILQFNSEKQDRISS